MNVWVLLLSSLLALPAAAQERGKKDDRKAAPASPSPTSSEDLMAEAEAKAAEGDFDAAADLLRRAQAAAGASGEPSLRLGRLLEGHHDLDLAVDAYREAAEKLEGPAKGEALGRMAVAQATRGMPEAAETARAAAEADPEGAWPLVALARLRAREGRADDALGLAQKALDAGAGAAGRAALGFAQEAKGDLPAAEAAYREALAAQAGEAAATLGLARVLRKTGRAAEAEPMLRQVLDAAPGAIEAYKESARVKLALNRASDAVGDASIAAAMAENDPDAQRLVLEVKVAQALDAIAQQQADLAIQDLNALAAQHPEAAEVHFGLGRAHLARRDADHAAAAFAKAAELDAGMAEAHFQLGYVRHALKGDAKGALEPYEKAAAADPSNLGYRTNLGAVLYESGQVDRAVAELTRVVETPGYDKADGWLHLGAAHLAANRFKDASAALNKAVAIAPDNAAAAAFLGWSYFGLKDADNFKKHAARARSLGWKDERLLERLKRVEAGEPIK